MKTELRIALLGKLEFTLDNTPLTGFITSKVPALLVYLILSDRALARERLAEMFWGEMSDTDAKSNLRQLLVNLRHLLPVHVLTTRESVTFDHTQPFWLDVQAFEENLRLAATAPDAAARVQHLRQAVTLYRGDFLEGFHVRDAPDFDEWLTWQRERLREQAWQALHTLAAHYAQRREYLAGIECLRRLLALDSWREEAHSQLMLLLARSGQRSAALAQYQICRRTLAAELGVEPSAEVTALYERIRAIGALPSLPAVSAPLVGRQAELDDLAARLADPACRLLTIIGPGGIGKTRLALALTHCALQQGDFINGACLVNLAAITHPHHLPATLLEALQAPNVGGNDQSQQLLDLLRNRELLLVLDNFEHLLPAASLLVDIMQQAPAVKLLITSRTRLGLRDERLFHLDGLAFPTTDTAVDPLSFDAVALFVACAQRQHRYFAPTAADYRAIVQICRLLAGMPLGLELAAAQAPALSCTEIAEQLGRTSDFLAATWPDAPPRHRSLRAVFEHAWNFLTPEEQVTLAQASVFAGSFDAPAARGLLAEVKPLANLVNKSLLRHLPDGRYELHPVVHQYAADKLGNWPDLQATTLARHAAYFAAFLHERESRLKGKDGQAALVEVSAVAAEIRRAWQWGAQEVDSRVLRQAMESLMVFYDLRGPFQEGHAAFREASTRVQEAWLALSEAAQAAQPQLARLLAGLLIRQGWLGFRLARYDEAQRLIEEGMALFQRVGVRTDLAYPHLFLGAVAYGKGDYAAALPHFESSLALYREAGDHWGMAGVLGNLGEVCSVMGNPTQALIHLREGLAVAREVGDPSMLVHTMNTLGGALCLAGAYAEAEQLLHESESLCTENGYTYLSVMALRNLALALVRQGGSAAARQTYHRALQIALNGQLGDLALLVISEAAVNIAAPRDPAQAVAWLTLVMRHPDASAETKRKAAVQRSALSTEMLPAHAARSLTLEDVLAEIGD